MDQLVKVIDLKKWFTVRRSFLSTILSGREMYCKAVDGVSFDIGKGEIFGLAGESGSGKTTTGRAILNLIEPTGGEVYFEGSNILKIDKSEMKYYRQRMQMIYQNPYESVNPRMRVSGLVSEPISVHNLAGNRQDKEELVAKALENVDLTPPEMFTNAYPHQLSGGQLQRVNIARCLVLNPEFIVADEPVSMLDASLRIEVLNVLSKLRGQGIASLFISHDLAILRYVCDRIAIMYLGKIVEVGPTENLLSNPLHPYTIALIAAVPEPDPKAEKIKVVIGGEIPSPVNPPPGCKFHPRCPQWRTWCEKKEPDLIEVESQHYVACHSF